jgi:hypothetical protein
LDEIVCYDRSALNEVFRFLSPLDLRWDSWAGYGVVRLSKKFPEEFAAFCQSLPPDVILELAGDLESLKQDAIAGSVRLDVTEADIDWFDLKVILDTSETDLTPEAAICLTGNLEPRTILTRGAVSRRGFAPSSSAEPRVRWQRNFPIRLKRTCFVRWKANNARFTGRS